MIELQDLEGISHEGLVDLLLDQNTQPFEIYIPKTTRQFHSPSGAIAYDYAYLAYSGQLLGDAAQQFFYEEVTPDLHESVLFRVSTSNITGLAAALIQIAFLYGFVPNPDGEEDDDENSLMRAETVEDFLDKVESRALVPFCPYFIEVYNDFNTNDEDDQEDDEDDQEDGDPLQ